MPLGVARRFWLSESARPAPRSTATYEADAAPIPPLRSFELRCALWRCPTVTRSYNAQTPPGLPDHLRG